MPASPRTQRTTVRHWARSVSRLIIVPMWVMMSIIARVLPNGIRWASVTSSLGMTVQ